MGVRACMWGRTSPKRSHAVKHSAEERSRVDVLGCCDIGHVLVRDGCWRVIRQHGV